MAHELDIERLADAVMSDLVARVMLGEPHPYLVAADCARLAKERDRRGKTIYLRAADAHRVLVVLVKSGWPIRALDGRRFALVDAGSLP